MRTNTAFFPLIVSSDDIIIMNMDTRSAPVNSIAYLFHVITESTSHSADHLGLTEARLLANLIQHTGINSELGRTENKWTD